MPENAQTATGAVLSGPGAGTRQGKAAPEFRKLLLGALLLIAFVVAASSILVVR